MRNHLSSVMRLSIFLGVGLFLSACAAGSGGFGSTIAPQSVSAPASQPLRPPPQLAPPPRAETLIGLDVYGLRNEFGSPAFQRSEPGAEVWRYDGKACALFIYLYEDEAVTLRTAFVEARAHAGGEVSTAPCIADISREHQLSAQGY